MHGDVADIRRHKKAELAVARKEFKKTWSLSSAAVAVPTLWLRRSQWKRSQRLRALVQIAVQVELRGPVKTPIFHLIAQEAAAMRDRGDRVSAIPRNFGVDYHTADKAIRWYRQR